MYYLSVFPPALQTLLPNNPKNKAMDCKTTLDSAWHNFITKNCFYFYPSRLGKWQYFRACVSVGIWFNKWINKWMDKWMSLTNISWAPVCLALFQALGIQLCGGKDILTIFRYIFWCLMSFLYSKKKCGVTSLENLFFIVWELFNNSVISDTIYEEVNTIFKKLSAFNSGAHHPTMIIK